MSMLKSTKSALDYRRKSEGSITTPGPAAYNISRDLCKRSISFSRATKSGDKRRFSPGPGSYNIPSEFGTGPKVIIPSGRVTAEPSPCPGPSDYFPNYSLASIKYSFPRRGYSTKSEITPGPGDYEVPKLSSAPRATFGRARRALLNSINDPQQICIKQRVSSVKHQKKIEFHKSFENCMSSFGLPTNGKDSLNIKEKVKKRSEFFKKGGKLKENLKPPRMVNKGKLIF